MNITNKIVNNKTISMFLLLLSFIPAYMLYRLECEDAYWYLIYPSCKIYKMMGHLNMNYIVGQNAFVIVLSEITNIGLDKLQFLPITGILLPIVGYTIMRKISNSNLIAALFAFYLGFNLTNLLAQYSVGPIGINTLLFFIFLILFYIYLIQKPKDVKILILLILIFVTIHFTYYGVEVWVLVMMITFNALLWVVYRYHGCETLSKLPINLTLAFTIIFFAFDEIFYKGFLARLKTLETPYYTLHWIYSKILPLLGKTQLKYGYEYVQITPIKDYLTTLQIAILLIFLLGLTLRAIHKVIFTPQYGKDTKFYLAVSLAGVIVAEISIYFLRGCLQLRTLYLLAPVSIVLLTDIGWKNSKRPFKIKLVFMVSICFIVMSSFLISYNTEKLTYYSQYDKVITPANWYEQHAINDSKILTDMNTMYHLKMVTVYSGKDFHYLLYYNQIYGKLVDGNITSEDLNYLVVDYGALDDMLISTTPQMDWKVYTPLSYYYSKIETNPCLNRVYTDSTIEIWSAND